MAALGGAALIGADLLLTRGPTDTRVFVVGVAHAGGGEFGQDRLQCGAGFGGQGAVQGAHAVAALRAQGQAALGAAGAFLVVAVGVQDRQQMGGQGAVLLGGELGGQAGQVCFGGLAVVGVQVRRQLPVDVAGDVHVFGPDRPGGHRRSQGGQSRF